MRVMLNTEMHKSQLSKLMYKSVAECNDAEYSNAQE